MLYYYISENEVIESVQFFKVKANFNIKTQTALNELGMQNDCSCDYNEEK